METDADSETNIRPMAVAGQFYPDNKEELKKMVDDFLKSSAVETEAELQAVIVPHAGYVFSGQMAAKAYSAIPPSARYKRIFLLGPSHVAAFDGASVNTAADFYETPLGLVKVDSATARKLPDVSDAFSYVPKAHGREHCLEVQLPFLQETFRNLPPIVPIIIGTMDINVLEKIAAALQPYFTPDNLFVISSDFSHYTSYDAARQADLSTAKALCSGRLAEFANALRLNAEKHLPNFCTSACGAAAIAVLLLMAEKARNVKVLHLGYENSGDSPYGGKDEVVGYNAFALVRTEDADAVGFNLTAEEKTTLLAIARRSVEHAVGAANGGPIVDESLLTDTLRRDCGAFVTLNEDGHLRGCIGNLVGEGPLYETVVNMAAAAATEDPRFSPVRADELENINIEISVLSPLRRIASADEIVLGRDGVLMACDGRHGTFLPQVANETGWTKEEFLGHLSRDKAGLDWNDWKRAELYTYQAVVFGEEYKQ